MIVVIKAGSESCNPVCCRHTPQPIPLGEPIESVKCGFDGTMFLTTSGTLLACGSNQFNKLGLNDRVSLRMQLKKLLGNVVVSVHVIESMALCTPCWVHVRKSMALCTPCWIHVIESMALCTPCWVHVRESMALCTPCWVHVRESMALCTPCWVHVIESMALCI